MEPSEVNPPSSEDAQLKRFLQDASPTLPDDGFSKRVIAALPARTTSAKSFFRIIVCALGALSGAAFASSRGVTWPALSSLPERFAAQLSGTIPHLMNPSNFLALILTALSLLVAFRAQLRRNLFD